MFTKFRSVRRVFYLNRSKVIFGVIAAKMLSILGWSFELIQETLSPADDISPYKELQKLLIDKCEFKQQLQRYPCC